MTSRTFFDERESLFRENFQTSQRENKFREIRCFEDFQLGKLIPRTVQTAKIYALKVAILNHLYSVIQKI